MRLEAVLIVWRDAHADQRCTNWCSVTDLEGDGDYLVRTVGWRLAADDDADIKTGHVTVAQSVGAPADAQGIGDALVDNVLHVPRENVVLIQSMLEHRWVSCD